MSGEATLGQLVVQLIADTVRFEGDLGKAAEIARDRMSEIHGFFKSNLALITAELATVTAGLTEMFASGQERADASAVLAKQIGLTVESLTQLQYVAKQADVPIESVGTAMRFLSKNVADAAGGLPAAMSKFAALGISIHDVQGNIKSTDELFAELAGKFEQYADGPIKTADAIAFFGRAGNEILPILDKGAKGIDDLRKRSDELGFTLKGPAAESAEIFHQKWVDIQATWIGVKQTFAADLAPMLTTLTSYLLEANKNLDIFNNAFKLIGKGFDIAGAAIRSVKDVAGNAIGVFTGFWDAILHGGTINLAAPFTMVKKDVQDIEKEFANATKTLDEFVAKSKEGGGGKKQAPIIEKGQTESISQQYDEVYDDIQKKTTKLVLSQSHSFSQIAENWKGNTKSMNASSQHLWDQLDAAGLQGAQGIQTDLEQFLIDPAKEGFAGLAMAFIKTIEEMVAKAAAAEILQSLFGSAGASGQSGGLGALFSGLMTSGSVAGAKAGGGPVSSGSTYLVGENGPELFTPSHAGNILANGTAVGGGSNFNHTYYIDAKGADADRIQRMLPGVMEQTRAATKRDIFDAFRRSGLPSPRFG